MRQKLEDRSAKLAKASQDLQALAQRAEVQTTACEHKVRGRCAVTSSRALTQWVRAQVYCLQTHGLGACKLERRLQLADAEPAYGGPCQRLQAQGVEPAGSKVVASRRH